MPRYHTSSNGTLATCRAKSEGSCPLGGSGSSTVVTPHYELSKNQARALNDTGQVENFSKLDSVTQEKVANEMSALEGAGASRFSLANTAQKLLAKQNKQDTAGTQVSTSATTSPIGNKETIAQNLETVLHEKKKLDKLKRKHLLALDRVDDIVQGKDPGSTDDALKDVQKVKRERLDREEIHNQALQNIIAAAAPYKGASEKETSTNLNNAVEELTQNIERLKAQRSSTPLSSKFSSESRVLRDMEKEKKLYAWAAYAIDDKENSQVRVTAEEKRIFEDGQMQQDRNRKMHARLQVPRMDR